MNGEDKPITGGLNSLIENLLRPIGKPIGQLTGSLGGGLARMVAPAQEESWRGAATRGGEAIPRLAGEALAFGQRRFPLLRAAGLADVGLQAYSQPGADIGTAMGQMGAFAAAPSVGGKAIRMAEPVAKAVESAVAGRVPSYLAGLGVRGAAGTAGGFLPFEVANAIEAYRRGETYDPLSAEHLVGTAATVLPFTALHIPEAVRGFRRAISPLVTKTPISDQPEVWRVHYNTHNEDRQMEFNDKQSAFDFADQLRKTLRIDPQVEMAGTMPRQWVKHNMAWSPQQLQGNLFGMRTSEVLNTLPQTEMPGQQMLGTLKNKVPKSEWEALPGFEDFLKSQPRVHPQAVQDWLDQNAPRVEIRASGTNPKSEEERAIRAKQAEAEHKLDTIRPRWRDESSTDAVYEWPKEVKDLYEIVDKGDHALMYSGEKIPAYWGDISPKPESEMQDYVEGAVVVPLRHPDKTEDIPENRAPQFGGLTDVQRGQLFPSSHSFPPNTLGWFRGYMETDPQGKKTFHVIEVQSDWAQKRREAEKVNPNLKPEGGRYGPATHSLLPQWERLTLKAAIDHAIKNGADRIAVSDAETAMMTEGHDLAATKIRPIDVSWLLKKEKQYITNEKPEGLLKQWFGPDWRTGKYVEFGGEPYRVDDPQKNFGKSVSFRGQSTVDIAKELQPYADVGGDKITQEPGMRLHYDKIIPQILRELTGEKGERVKFGEHKMAFIQAGGEEAGQIEGQPRSDLIFREPTGEPKTSITAQSYGLEKTKSELAKRGGFPMFGSEKFVKAHVDQMIREGYSVEDTVKAAENVKMLQPFKGETALQTLARSVGIDPKLFADMPPGEALPKALEFLTSMFHYNYGQPIDHAAYLARQVALPLARFAPFLKRTAFAIQEGSDLASKFLGFKEPQSDAFKFLISIHDFPKAKPLDATTFQIAATLAHESAHNAIHEAMNPVGDVDPETRRAVIKALANVEAIHPDERMGVMRSLMRLVVPSGKWNQIDKANFDTYKDSAQEFLADFAAMIGVGSTKAESVANLRDAMTFGDRASQEFSKAIYRDLTAIWSGAKDILELTGSNRENKILAGLVNTVYDNLTKIMQTTAQAERTLDSFHGLMDRIQSGPLDPPPVVSNKQLSSMIREFDKLEGFPVNASHVEASSKLTDEALSWIRPPESRLAGERLGFWKDYFKPMAQLVESLRDKVQSAVPVFALGSDYRGMVSEAQNRTWSLWKDEQDKPDWKRLHWLSKDGTPQERAFSKIGLLENVRTDQGETEPLTREEKEKIFPEYKRLSDADKDKVDTSHTQAWAMTRLLAKRQWDAHRDRISENMAKLLMSYDKTMYRDKAKPLADEAVHWVFDTPKNFDEFQDFFNAREKFFASLPIPDKGKTDLEAAIRENLEPWQKLGDRLLGFEDPQTGERPGRMAYLPEVRVREWHVAWKLAGENLPHHEAFKTEKLAVKRRDEVARKEGLEWVKGFNPKDRTDRYRGALQEQISSAQQDALDALKNSVLSRISSEHPEAQEILKRINAEFQPATAFQNIAVSPYMRQREFIPGREDLNMVEGLVRYTDAAAYQMAKRHVVQAGETTLFNPDMRENPNIRNAFEKYLHFVTDAEGKEFTNLKNLVFFNYLGLNPVQILVEPTQQLVTLAPYLVEKGMGIGQAYKALWKANQDLFHSYSGDKKLKDPIEEAAMKDAVLRRVVDTGMTSDLYGETDLDFAMERSAFTGNDQLKDKIDLVRRPLYQLLAFARHMYGKYAPAHNSRVAFLTAFRMEYARTQDKEAAMRFATQANAATMFVGGKAARPMVLQQFGQMSGVGGLMYTLGSYTLSTMAMMMRLGLKSINRSGLDAAGKTAAKKAAGLMWGTQFALGGALGLPFVAAGIALLEQVFPGLDVRKGVREAFVNMAGDDEDIGHTVADGAMRGVPNLSPVDFGSRFQLANLLGVSPYDGFSWANVAGPAANMMKNYVTALGQASTGDFGQAARTAAPSSIKNILNLVHDDWAVRDKAGRMISEMTPVEQVMAAVGFKPKKITNYYEEQGIRERTEANQMRKIRDIRTEAAKFLVLGDVQSARNTILKGREDAGPYDPIDMAKEASQLAVEMQDPTLRRHGTRALADREAEISRLYPHSVPISEVARVLRQAQMVQQMGLQFGKPSLEQLRIASRVDALMHQNPRLSIEQARLLAEQQGSPSARRRSSISSLLQAR